MNNGRIYRIGIRIKEAGETLGRIPVIGLFFVPLISIGLKIKDSVMDKPLYFFR